MFSSKPKWLFYTVLVGAMPIIVRLLACFFIKTGHVDLFVASDLIYFGLILHVSNLNEVEHATTIDKDWRTKQNGLSVVFIIFYSLIYAFSLLPEVFSLAKITVSSLIIVPISLWFSYSVFNELSKIPIKKEL
jgi:hypothetical protein